MGNVTFTAEQHLVDHVARLLRSDGYRVRREVPSLGQSADLVGTKNRWVTFVEAKMRDWRRALQQCRGHEQVADYICIAVATVRRPDALVEIAKRRGYGIIHCQPKSGRCAWILPPARNQVVWRPQRLELGKALRVVDYER
jgi:hypothetical protein